MSRSGSQGQEVGVFKFRCGWEELRFGELATDTDSVLPA